MISMTTGEALHFHCACPKIRDEAVLPATDLVKRLICSSPGRVTGLFDESYLEALQKRDVDAQNRFVAQFSRPVLIKLRARLRSPELVQDAFQETFLRILSYFGSGKTLDRAGSLPGFVHSMCNNVALEMLRAHTRHDQIPENHPEPATIEPNPERQLVTGERKDFVRTLLNKLSTRDRQLLKRVFLDEEDKDAVCREFQVDRAYLRVLLFRARQSCRELASSDDLTGAAGG